MNSNRWKMYTYAVQRCQNEKKTLLFVLMESKGEEDIWRSCLQFSLSTRKKGGQKLRHSFLSRFSTPFPVSSKLWKNVIAHRAPHSKTVNQNWCMKSKKSWKKHFNCSKITVLLRKKCFLVLLHSGWKYIVQKSFITLRENVILLTQQRGVN